MRYTVVLLGVGGVGKTTLAYRLMGLSLKPRVTQRPGIYRIFLEIGELNIIDVPGQYLYEVIQNFVRMATFFVDKVLYMYDVTQYDTLQTILQLHSRLFERYIKPFKKIAIVGNKMDLAREIGIHIKGDEVMTAVGAREIYYISALYDDVRELIRILW